MFHKTSLIVLEPCDKINRSVMYQITTAIQKALTEIVGKEYISFSTADREAHSKDKSFHSASFPELILWPTSTKVVSAIMKLANKHRIPITAWGGGSSLEGNPIPVKGGIVLTYDKDEQGAFSPERRLARCRPTGNSWRYVK